MLILAATPIGRPDDASPRLAAALAEADIVAAEDTRRLRRLAAELNVTFSGRVVSYFDGNERERTPELVQAVADGRDVVLVTDAGMPSVADPGYRLVAACVEAGHDISAIPGPSAALTALAVSGLPVHRFAFEGFLPRKAGDRKRALAELAGEPRTMVFFESPRRAAETLQAMAEAFGADRRAALCRELTKTHEEVVRDSLAGLIAWAEQQEHGVRGEVTLVVEGGTAAEPTTDDLRRLVEEQQASGLSRKDAIAAVASATGVRRSVVYEAAHGSA
ncbi:MAG TPA: 16S rRNA (cytidine(1402)-2'-O)-methyltransferase [Aeromicrobium sp.]|nr:16S rRNA (cytidine(1402)-2'-O)-methyltransferase [Aeromicrobium sp.]